ncbi:hypothetical protein Taro_004235 [Colocasia esculenta]|uniref:SBP-type domain-containing protein n=1 Tax=Colocasia esculenta TaxID=4460 RepID=A0A843TUB2_COLES|nr:hypothetical protein [Colocasia esculenta]
MLGYEWANSAAMLLSYDPSEAAAQEQPHHPRHQMLPLYDRSCLDLAGALFPSAPPVPMSVAAATAEADYPLHHYGAMSLPPAPPAQAAMRIGLNLGVRTYFSSSPDGELMRLGRNVYQRSGGDAGDGVLGVLGGGGVAGAASCRARCQAEGCRADLTRAKHYHRRHKVCEYHSKAAAVVAHGLTQRFCQQCSRFHVLAEFDQGKRSCRKRLADHNRRRRKTQTLPPLLPPPSSQSDDSTGAAPADDSPPKLAAETTVTPQAPASAEGAPPGTCDAAPPAAAADRLAAPASPTWMALGRCLRSPEVVPGGNSSSSSSSTSSCSSPSCSVLQHLADFRRVPMSIWDAGVHGANGHRTD